jgi:hypothetical protein
MGGFGSGRPDSNSKKTTVEDCLALDVGAVVRAARQNRRLAGTTRWTRLDSEAGSINWAIDELTNPEQIYLSYRWRNEPVQFPLSIVTTTPHFGGLRYWAICPLVVNGRPCQRRVAKLYSPANCRYFGCRICLDLTYRSCQNGYGRLDRLFARYPMFDGLARERRRHG